MPFDSSGYKHIPGNSLIRAAGQNTNYTRKELEEYHKCKKDYYYFVENYCYIKTLKSSKLELFIPRDYQHRMIDTVIDNNYTVIRCGRQMGKSTSICSFIVWKILFNNNFCAGILANLEKTSIKLLDDCKRFIENLPKWMQQGCVEWNKKSVVFENGSKIVTGATSENSARTESFNLLLLDEFAHVPQEKADTFYQAVFPTLTSADDTKLVIVSTPKGRNLYYRIWTEAVKGKNGFAPVDVEWNEFPGRGEKWKKEIVAKIGEKRFRTEFECEFIGSTDTLINPKTLKIICDDFDTPLTEDGGLRIYEEPQENSIYFVLVDTSEGVGADSSTIQVIKISSDGFDQVATFQDNSISTIIYPEIIKGLAEKYNNAQVLIEINDLGAGIANSLVYDYDYDNIIATTNDTSSGKGTIIASGSERKLDLGLKHNKKTKKLGCVNLKSMVEKKQLKLRDFNTLSELSTFIRKGQSFEAESGNHDDLVSPLVLLGWLLTQEIFKENTGVDLRKKLVKYIKEQENNNTPLILNDGDEDIIEIEGKKSDFYSWLSS